MSGASLCGSERLGQGSSRRRSTGGVSAHIVRLALERLAVHGGFPGGRRHPLLCIVDRADVRRHGVVAESESRLALEVITSRHVRESDTSGERNTPGDSDGREGGADRQFLQGTQHFNLLLAVAGMALRLAL